MEFIKSMGGIEEVKENDFKSIFKLNFVPYFITLKISIHLGQDSNIWKVPFFFFFK